LIFFDLSLLCCEGLIKELYTAKLFAGYFFLYFGKDTYLIIYCQVRGMMRRIENSTLVDTFS